MLIWPPTRRIQLLSHTYMPLLAAVLSCALTAAAQNQPAFTPTADQMAAVSGEYTDAADPDVPLSFYTRDGRLYVESYRSVPTELTAVSATEFSLLKSERRFRFATGSD